MKTLTLELQPNQSVCLRTSGDVYLSGQDGNCIAAVSRRNNTFHIQQTPEQVIMTCLDDCSISMPKTALIIVEKVGGDAHLRDMAADLNVKSVGGDLSLQSLAGISIDNIGGDCFFDQIAGNLTVRSIGGDLNGTELTGELNIEKVGGEVDLQNIHSGIILNANGDTRLVLDKPIDEDIHVKSGGDLSLCLPKETQAMLSINSRSRDISVHVEGQIVAIDSRYYQLKMGDGSHKIDLEVGGDVLVTDKPWGSSRLAEKSARLAEKWKRKEGKMTAQIRINLEEVDRTREQAERISRMTQDTLERAGRRIQAAIEELERVHPENWVSIPEVVIHIPPID
jgi:hypothetical protein